MLNIFKRNRRTAPAPADHDPLAIRNLLDDPRLRAVMATATDDTEVTSISTEPARRPERALLGAAA